MKVTILQKDIVWCNPQENRDRAEEMMHDCSNTDLFILPEMFTTGFCMQPKNIAETINGKTLQWMKHIAAEMSCAIAGSFAVLDNGKYYNRFYFVNPDGSHTHYDKSHLFTYGGEFDFYTAGQERIIITYQDIRILPAICYDLRFPVWTRNKGDYDMIIYVASWPTTRIKVWKTLLHARAVENQCYVIGANRVGSDPLCKYPGMSYIIGPYGNTIASLEQDTENTISATIDMEKLKQFRHKFPLLKDSDPFTLL